MKITMEDVQVGQKISMRSAGEELGVITPILVCDYLPVNVATSENGVVNFGIAGQERETKISVQPLDDESVAEAVVRTLNENQGVIMALKVAAQIAPRPSREARAAFLGDVTSDSMRVETFPPREVLEELACW